MCAHTHIQNPAHTAVCIRRKQPEPRQPNATLVCFWRGKSESRKRLSVFSMIENQTVKLLGLGCNTVYNLTLYPSCNFVKWLCYTHTKKGTLAGISLLLDFSHVFTVNSSFSCCLTLGIIQKTNLVRNNCGHTVIFLKNTISCLTLHKKI